MFVIGGDAPQAEFSDEAMHRLEAAGVWPQLMLVPAKAGTQGPVELTLQLIPLA